MTTSQSTPARALRALIAIAPLLALAAPAPAQESRNWRPTRAVSLIVPFALGAANDTMARVLAPRLAEIWGQPVIVVNRPGGNGTIGTVALVQSAPDGHSLLMTTPGVVIAPFLMKNPPYDLDRDLAPVQSLTFSHVVLLGAPGLPDRSLREFVAAVKGGKPRSIGVPDPVTQLLTARLVRASQADFRLVPYKGAGPILTDLVGNHVDGGLMTFVSSGALLRAGKIKGLAVFADERNPAFPDIPTAAEEGVPGMAVPVWGAILAPGATPVPIMEQISRDLLAATRDPSVEGKIKELGAVRSGESRDAFKARYLREIEETKGLVKAAGIIPE